MTFNETTFDCICDRCGHSWRSRSGKPVKCPVCSSYNWDDGTRRFQYILARINGTVNAEGYREFCILDEINRPDITTDDLFYIRTEDFDTYMKRARVPGGSAVIFIGSFELPESRILEFKEVKLIISMPKTFRVYGGLTEIYRKHGKSSFILSH